MFKKHINLTPTDPTNRDEWLKLRTNFTGINSHDRFAVGGSEIGTILNLNIYEATIEFYYRALGLAPPKKVENLQVLRGSKTEEIIYREWFRHFNPDEWNVWDDDEHQSRFIQNSMAGKNIFRTAQRCNAIVTNPKYPHIFINYDFLLHKSKWNVNGPLEIKSQMGAAMDKWELGINPSYAAQLQGQMLIGEFDYGELFVLRNAEIPVSFPTEPDKAIQDRIIEETKAWAEVIIMIKTMMHEGAPEDEVDMAVMEHEPDVEGTEAWNNYMKEEHKPENNLEIEAPKGFTEDVIKYLQYKRDEKKSAQERLLPEVKIRKAFNDSKVTKIILPEELGYVRYRKKLSISPKILQKYESR